MNFWISNSAAGADHGRRSGALRDHGNFPRGRQAPLNWSRRRYLVMLVFSLFALNEAPAAGLSEREAAGKRLYFLGKGTDGRAPAARIGRENTAVSADAVPCAGCHGDEGRGGREGGVAPTEITWRYLTKPYGHQHGVLRRHPAFTETTVATAIVKGIDPAGNRLDPAMPRYALRSAEMSALVAYLKRLEFDTPPGVADQSIRIGTILAPEENGGAPGREVQALLSALFENLNAHGGIFNRRLELASLRADASPEATLAKVRQFMTEQPVFAWLGADVTGFAEAMSELTEREGIPLLGPVSRKPGEDIPAGAFGFQIFSGIGEQARTLREYASTALPEAARRAAVVYAASGAFQAAATEVSRSSGEQAWNVVEKVQFRPGGFQAEEAVAKMRAGGAELVLFLGPPAEMEQLIAAAIDQTWSPYILAPSIAYPGPLAQMPPFPSKKLLFAYSSLPSDATPAGLAAFGTLRRKTDTDEKAIAAQVDAYCAALLLTEGLKSAGRDLTHKKFVASLEGFGEFETGLTPRLRFGPNRHTGAAGAYIVALDPADKSLKPIGSWRPAPGAE